MEIWGVKKSPARILIVNVRKGEERTSQWEGSFGTRNQGEIARAHGESIQPLCFLGSQKAVGAENNQKSRNAKIQRATGNVNV